MFKPDQYALLDFGDARKLEQWGPYRLDRGAPVVVGEAPRKSPWKADARHRRTDGERGQWTPPQALPSHWNITAEAPAGRLTFELKPTPFGHVGLFPEHAQFWPWLHAQIQSSSKTSVQPPKVLNLFAYTGAASLAMALSGAAVTHIDAAKNVVAWARRNAELSGLAEAPIRWIAEDATKFVQREEKRGNAYQGVLLDPPSFGHGPQGERWQLESQLPELLAGSGRLLTGDHAFFLATCHTPGFTPQNLAQLVHRYTPHRGAAISAQPLVIACRDGRRLDCGAAVWWSR
ncbi:class I SAM-dependent methyltransferase [Lignipirellula cremea]|uniref:Ribosomal RNA large subunit methyltransferase K n=1 Tax=Lignipirellula cremea TaxID=2528010 RepID=A0A518DMK3_9BACT|nr:class I SAM-dependent methyltransferase [Lignipirellula cremea]QDU93065.1 Ribosomal RNA large subunit methyltransferase K [Lignipirellula cremea]